MYYDRSRRQSLRFDLSFDSMQPTLCDCRRDIDCAVEKQAGRETQSLASASTCGSFASLRSSCSLELSCNLLPIHCFGSRIVVCRLFFKVSEPEADHVMTSSTTSSLAKTTKMIPVLLVARICYAKKASTREWAAAATIAIGCATYLSATKVGAAALEDDDLFYDGVVGGASLLLYLFFDGLTSTSQERYFGLSASSTDPFGPESSVLPQMIFVNLFTCVFSLVGLGGDFYLGTLIPSIKLLLTTRDLRLDVLALSATAAFGLVLLLNTIASFGALTCALLMTIRQFFGILLNAGVFRHVSTVGVQGWCGVGWVASGVYIKTNRSWDEKPIAIREDNDASQLLFPDKEETASRSVSPDSSPLPTYTPYRRPEPLPTTPSLARQYILQFALPLLLPLLAAIALHGIFPEMNILVSHPDDLLPPPPFSGAFDSSAPAPEYSEPVEIEVEGGAWEKQFHDANVGECDLKETQPWKGTRRTALASNPRSGNTFMRELVERATNWQTSTVSYCDQSLSPVFHGEVRSDAFFLSRCWDFS